MSEFDLKMDINGVDIDVLKRYITELRHYIENNCEKKQSGSTPTSSKKIPQRKDDGYKSAANSSEKRNKPDDSDSDSDSDFDSDSDYEDMRSESKSESARSESGRPGVYVNGKYVPLSVFIEMQKKNPNIQYSWFKPSDSDSDYEDMTPKPESARPESEPTTDFYKISDEKLNSDCPSEGETPKSCVNKTHYRYQTRIFHPDKNIDCVEDATKKFQQLGLMYSCKNAKGGKRSSRKYQSSRRSKTRKSSSRRSKINTKKSVRKPNKTMRRVKRR
jgi:hypothetical protein